MIGLLLTDKPLQDRPPVDDAQPQSRGRFQFSLRKLLLWMAVLGVYLGVLRLITANVSVVLISICWLAVIVAVRMKWGAHRALAVAITSTGLCLCVFLVAVAWIDAGQFRPSLLGRIILVMPEGFLVGAFIGLDAFVVAEVSLRFVNFLDGLMQTKTPHDDTGENSS